MQPVEVFVARVVVLEAKIEASGATVFGGGLDLSDAATIVLEGEGDVMMTDLLQPWTR